MRKVMVFGVFDVLHEGHREMLRHAKREGDHLIAVVAQDHVVQQLKGHLPQEHIGDRMENLLREGLADRVVEGDVEIGAWQVVRNHKPDVVCIGYDQHDLRNDLEDFLSYCGSHAEVRVMPAHKPEMYHSSLLRRDRK